jgi:hypothetical protein
MDDLQPIVQRVEQMGADELDRLAQAVYLRRLALGLVAAKQAEGGARGEGGGAGARSKGREPSATRVLEYRPYGDGMLQLEERCYVRRDGSKKWRGPYWQFRYHSGGRQRMLYLGRTDDPESVLDRKRAQGPSYLAGAGPGAEPEEE